MQQPIDQLISQLQEDDMVQFVSDRNKRFVGFYEGKKVSDLDYLDSLWFGHEKNKSQDVFTMCNSNGFDPSGEDYCLEKLPEFYLTSELSGLYRIGEDIITSGLIIRSTDFLPLPTEDNSGLSGEDHFKRAFSTVYRFNLPGENNYIVGNIVAFGASDPYCLISPITGWKKYPLYIEISEVSERQGTLHIPKRTPFVEEDLDEDHFITGFNQIPVLNIEYFLK